MAETVRSHPRPGSNTNGNLIAFGSKGGGGGSFWDEDLAPTLTAHGDDEGGQPPAIAYALRKDPGGVGQGHNTNYVAAPLVSRSSRGNAQGNSPGHNADESLVHYGFNANRGQANDLAVTRDAVPPLHSTPVGVLGAGVRRLTPTECERLQGFPDGWTQLGATPDSRRYSALGDAVTATVAEWIGRRLQ